MLDALTAGALEDAARRRAALPADRLEAIALQSPAPLDAAAILSHTAASMAASPKSVFLDASGRRARRLRIGAALVGVLALALLSGFLFSVWRGPQMAALVQPGQPQPARHLPNHKFAAARKALLAQIQAERRRLAAAQKRLRRDELRVQKAWDELTASLADVSMSERRVLELARR